MGVTGCGKSTVATLLGQRLNGKVIEADALHGSQNIDKMKRGEALSDDDRWPWLVRVANAMQASRTPVLVSCSALRRAYRQCLLDNSGVQIGFIHLHAKREVFAERMSNRKDHFMPVSLLDSQLELLESLNSDGSGVVVDVDKPIQRVIDEAMLFVQKN